MGSMVAERGALDYSEQSASVSFSQIPTPSVTPSPPAITRTSPGGGGLVDATTIDESSGGVLRSRGRRRRVGTPNRVRLQDEPEMVGESQSKWGLLRPPSSTLSEPISPSSPGLTRSRGSFKSMVRTVSKKMTPAKKQGKLV